MKGFMDENVLSEMKRAGDDAVKSQMMIGNFITLFNGLAEEREFTKGKLAAAANISERTLLRLRTDETYVPSLQTLVALCVGMQLSYSESMILLDMSPYRLRRTEFQDGVYTYILHNNVAMTVDEANIYLSELGCKRLGNII